MRKSLLSTLAVLLLLGMASTCPAQVAPATGEIKPLVTIAFSGYDEVLADIDFVGQLAGDTELAKGLEGMLQQLTGGQGLAGLDKTKPWGAVIQTDGLAFPMYGFVPVTDLKQLTGLLKDPATGQPPPEPADGVYELDIEGVTLLATQKGGWAFVARSREDLTNTPADPAALLGGLEKKYDLVISGLIKNIPEMYRQLFSTQLEAGALLGLPRMPGESDDEYQARVNVTREVIRQLVATFNDLDELLLGFAVDRQAGASYLDVQLTAVAGSKTAQQFAEMSSAQTELAGFDIPGAAVTGNITRMLTDADVAQVKAGLVQMRSTALKELENEGLSGEELKLATQLLGDLFDVAEKTMEGKKLDAGMALLLKPSALTLVAGVGIAEGAKLEKLVKQLAQLAAADNPDVGKALTLDAETHQGVRFHTLAVPTDELGDQNAVKLFGPTLDVVLGINDQNVYLAVGSNAAATLKQVIDQSKAAAGKAVPPLRIAVALTPIMQFAAALAEGPEKQMIAEVGNLLSQSAGKDRLTITTTPIPNGARTRVELEEGLLKLIGILPKKIQEMQQKMMEEMMKQMQEAGGPAQAVPVEESPF